MGVPCRLRVGGPGWAERSCRASVSLRVLTQCVVLEGEREREKGKVRTHDERNNGLRVRSAFHSHPHPIKEQKRTETRPPPTAQTARPPRFIRILMKEEEEQEEKEEETTKHEEPTTESTPLLLLTKRNGEFWRTIRLACERCMMHIHQTAVQVSEFWERRPGRWSDFMRSRPLICKKFRKTATIRNLVWFYYFCLWQWRAATDS